MNADDTQIKFDSIYLIRSGGLHDGYKTHDIGYHDVNDAIKQALFIVNKENNSCDYARRNPLINKPNADTEFNYENRFDFVDVIKIKIF